MERKKNYMLVGPNHNLIKEKQTKETYKLVVRDSATHYLANSIITYSSVTLELAHPSNLRGPSPVSGVGGDGLLNSASRVFLFKAVFDTLDTEPNTGMDLDSEVANIPLGP